jgi:hypothetical protein
VATVEEVDGILTELMGRLGALDQGTRSMLPTRRTIEARCPDLELVRHAEWRDGVLHTLDQPPTRRADIRVALDSDTLVAMHRGDLTFSRAYASNRIRLDASMTDLLRLRTVL